MNRRTIVVEEGVEMPLLGLGTWDLRGKECTDVVKMAIEMGYRHIDTAHFYENHLAIAKAIAKFDRSALFLTSKFAMDQLEEGKEEASIRKALLQALDELGVEYLDLYLIHWPDPSKRMDLLIKTMHQMREEGKIRAVGVSNFTIHHLQDLMHSHLEVAANQVEFHPYLYQKDLLDFCKQHRIQLIAYRPFGLGEICKDPVVKKIGKKHNKTAAQTLLRWLIQQDICAIPKASTQSHLKENLEVFDFHLSEQEMDDLYALNRDHRYCNWKDSEFD